MGWLSDNTDCLSDIGAVKPQLPPRAAWRYKISPDAGRAGDKFQSRILSPAQDAAALLGCDRARGVFPPDLTSRRTVSRDGLAICR